MKYTGEIHTKFSSNNVKGRDHWTGFDCLRIEYLQVT
jgi:hypothetical protein